jgi:hypothetical protein
MTDLGASSNSMRHRLAVLLAALAVIAVMAGVGASSSLAFGFDGYANEVLYLNETRDSGHYDMLENIGDAHGFGSICVDVYYEPGGYSGAVCGSGPAIYPEDRYGYGRAWEHSSEGDVDAVLEYET